MVHYRSIVAHVLVVSKRYHCVVIFVISCSTDSHFLLIERYNAYFSIFFLICLASVAVLSFACPTSPLFLSPSKEKFQTSRKQILSLYLPRFRPTQAKPKKTKTETKLEFFGFEDKEDQEGEEGPEGGTAGKSSYKIKYFGFDDLSESDSDEESSHAKEKKAKKAAAALAALSSSVDSPHTSDSQDSQASSNTGELTFNLSRYGHLNHISTVHSYIDAPLMPPTIWFVQQMLLTSLMTPVLAALRDIKDARGKQVINQRTLAVDSKRSSVDPKRYLKVLKNCFTICFHLVN